MSAKQSTYPTGLQILSKREPPTMAEWLDLAEWRRSQIKPHLSKMTLEQLGNVHCLMSNKKRVRFELSSDTFDTPWNMRGIFDTAYRPKNPQRLSSLWVWGLAQNGEWFAIDIKVEMRDLPDDFTGRELERVIGYHIEGGGHDPSITAKDIWEMTDTSPRRINRILAKAIKAYADKKSAEKLAADALYQQIVGEEAALRARGCNTGK